MPRIGSISSFGDDIAITRNDGTRLKFEVTEVSPEGIGGSELLVPYADIRMLSVSVAK